MIFTADKLAQAEQVHLIIFLRLSVLMTRSE